MSMIRMVVALAGANALVLVTTVARAGAGGVQAPAGTLRGSALELVDRGGRIRVRLNVESDGEVGQQCQAAQQRRTTENPYAVAGAPDP